LLEKTQKEKKTTYTALKRHIALIYDTDPPLAEIDGKERRGERKETRGHPLRCVVMGRMAKGENRQVGGNTGFPDKKRWG